MTEIIHRKCSCDKGRRWGVIPGTDRRVSIECRDCNGVGFTTQVRGDPELHELYDVWHK